MNPCACGAVQLHTALSVWSNGIQHFPADVICVATDELLVDGGAA